MRRTLTVLLSTLALSAVWVGPAAAHVALMPSETDAEQPLETQLIVTHGCGPEGEVPMDEDEAAPITSVTMQVPEGVDVQPREVDGWQASVDTGHGPTQIIWDSEDGQGQALGLQFDLELTAAADLDGEQVWFPVVQDCIDGESMAWTQTSGPGEATYPAASLTVGDPDAGLFGGDGPPTWAIFGLIALVALAAGAAVVVLTGRGADEV